MAESCSPLPTGGYECEFVDSVPESLSCPICLLPFRDPHLLDCCGAKYCGVCITRVKTTGQPCPLCKEQFNTMLDKGFGRQVLELKVYCSKRSDGCEWKGELRHLEGHVREECGWTEAQCSYQRGVLVPRHQLAEHERNVCPQRPMDIKVECMLAKLEAERKTEKERHEREIHDLKECHRKEIAAVRDEMAAVRDEMAVEREKFRQEMARTERLQVVAMAALEEKLERKIKGMYDTKIMDMQQKLVTFTRETRAHMSVPPCEFTMTQYWKLKRNDDEWYSTPFYSGPGGYKMCLQVDPKGFEEAADTHVSVFVYLMRGEYDDRLVWPFRGNITIQLINQISDREHYKDTICFDDETGSISHRVISRVRAIDGWGEPEFIRHTKVEAITPTTRYIKDKCMKLRVTKVVVHSQ